VFHCSRSWTSEFARAVVSQSQAKRTNNFSPRYRSSGSLPNQISSDQQVNFSSYELETSFTIQSNQVKCKQVPVTCVDGVLGIETTKNFFIFLNLLS
jgi:hypothetical protein